MRKGESAALGRHTRMRSVLMVSSSRAYSAMRCASASARPFRNTFLLASIRSRATLLAAKTPSRRRATPRGHFQSPLFVLLQALLPPPNSAEGAGLCSRQWLAFAVIFLLCCIGILLKGFFTALARIHPLRPELG